MDFRELSIPIHEHLGLVIEADENPSRVLMPLKDDVRGAVAPVHGGLLSLLCDVACAATLGGGYDPTTHIPVSTDLQVKFFRQPKEGPLVATGTVTHAGRTLVVAECVVEDGLGRQVARGSGTYLLVGGFHDHAG